MNIYWQTTTNQVLDEAAFQARVDALKESIVNWASHELFAEGVHLEQFVEEKVHALKQSYLVVSLPYQTVEACEAYIEAFYHDYQSVVDAFPYDRWVWVKKLEGYEYSEIDYRAIAIQNKLVDHKLSEETMVH